VDGSVITIKIAQHHADPSWLSDDHNEGNNVSIEIQLAMYGITLTKVTYAAVDDIVKRQPMMVR